MIPYRTAAVNKKRVSLEPARCGHRPCWLSSGPVPGSGRNHGNLPEMALTLSDVMRIAHLARIEVTDTEARQTLGQLNDIFKLIEQLQSVDTSGIEPMAHPLGGSQRLREDEVVPTDNRSEHMKNAPAQQDGLFLVPKVIE